MKKIPIRPSPVRPPETDLQRAVRELARVHSARPGPLLPLLHAVQDRFGYIAPEAIPVIADELNLSRAEVHGVVSYYHHFRSEPAGRVLLQICQAEACRARGSGDLVRAAEAMTGCAMHTTHADGSVSLEPVYCLGLCAMGPSVMLNGRPYARVSASRLRVLLDAAFDAAAIPNSGGSALRSGAPTDEHGSGRPSAAGLSAVSIAGEHS